MQLPLIDDAKLAQTKWKSILDPLLAKPLNSGNLLTNINLVTGVNVINHRLGRLMQGWIVTDQNSNATFYRSSSLNDLTLTLTSSANSTVSILVF